MNITFKTNLDWYKTVQWPQLNYLPNIGDKVEVVPEWVLYCQINEIPTELSVISIKHKVGCVEIDLWYSENLIKLSSKERINHLMKQ